MIILSTTGIYMDRRYDMLTAASLTALIFIAMNPYIIFNAGFQMSFIAVCSIAFFYKRMPYKIPDSVAIMISANVGLMLYQIYVFNWFSVSSFIANVPVVYLVSITVPLGLDTLYSSALQMRSRLRTITFGFVRHDCKNKRISFFWQRWI